MAEKKAVPNDHRDGQRLRLGAGAAEEAFATRLKSMHETLDKAKIQHVTFESPGTAHEWQTWRRSLLDFAPRLFRD